MKIALICDTHFGIRQDSQVLLDYQEKFFREVFFPALKSQEIDAVIHLGDIFDKRKHINLNTLHHSRKMFFNPLDELGCIFIAIVGNHDAYFEEKNDVNSPMLVLNEYKFQMYDRPKEINLGGMSFLLVPWVTTDNRIESETAINISQSDILLGHLEITGFQRTKGNLCDNGFDPKVFTKFKMVGSGHFHGKSQQGHIMYLGTPYEMTWEDAGQSKGFHILDTETNNLEFIENPHKLFRSIRYNDSGGDQIPPKDLKDCYVRVTVESKSDPYLFNLFMSEIDTQKPVDVTVIDQSAIVAPTEISDVDVKHTKDIMKEYVEGMTGLSVKSTDVITELNSLFHEAESV